MKFNGYPVWFWLLFVALVMITIVGYVVMLDYIGVALS